MKHIQVWEGFLIGEGAAFERTGSLDNQFHGRGHGKEGGNSRGSIQTFM
jgi:hypothetical protein